MSIHDLNNTAQNLTMTDITTLKPLPLLLNLSLSDYEAMDSLALNFHKITNLSMDQCFTPSWHLQKIVSSTIASLTLSGRSPHVYGQMIERH